MHNLLPYKVEYCVGEQACKKCDKKIRSGVLKIAIMMQSEEDDCQYPDWYHRKCFFKTHLPKTEAAFDGYAKLRYSDQLGIKEEMGIVEKTVVKRVPKSVKNELPKLSDFSIETTKVVRDSCYGCSQKFVIPEVRIMRVIYKTDLTDESFSFGGQATWYHVICFSRSRSELGWLESGENLPGFKRLSDVDKTMVKRLIPMKRRNCNTLVEETTDEVRNELEKLIELQNREYYDLYDKIAKNFPKKDQLEILKFNRQFVPTTKPEIIHQLTEILYFGKPENCSLCYSGTYYFNNSIYSCSTLCEWGRCGNDVREPKRTVPYVPFRTREKYPFLSNLTCRARALHQFKLKDDCGQDLIDVPYQKPPLFNMEFAVIGKLKMPRQEIENTIKQMGGKVVMGIHDKLAAVISNEEEIKKMSAKMTLAKTHNIQVASEDFLSNIASRDPYLCIFSHCISEWGGNETDFSSLQPYLRVEEQEEVKPRRETMFYTKTIPERITYDDENDLVDGESGLKGSAHVYCRELQPGKQIKYMAVLGLVDIEMNRNSYYRMQLLESNDCKSYWIFESWGRISTLIGATRLTSHDSVDDACTKFRSVFSEKCGNEFGTFYYYKRPGKHYPLNIDFEITKRKPNSFIKSNLDKPVYDLMKMIFDTKHLKKTMSYDLDLKKMPLGQLRCSQINEAMSVLRKIETLIMQNGTSAQLRNASNEFYTLIPHGFSIKRPTIIDSVDVVKAKTEMLEGLSNMHTIYGFFQGNNGEKLNPMDACYEKIATDIKLLDKNAPEFAKIDEIVQKTHGSTHRKYTLQVIEVFKIKRKREDVRSRKYKKLDRQMLWHGSKLINFVSILSKGLRIAPKEAPSTGYMFGKGMYFADVVSKSANYCSQKDNTGLLLLCDVALGNSKSVTYAHQYDDIPNENEQSVKAFGATYPTEYSTLDGIKVATGGLRKANFPTGLHYNEYVVYDIAQVKMKYLVKVKFNYK